MALSQMLPHHRQAQLQRSDSTPHAPEIPCLHTGWARGMVTGHRIDHALRERLPEPLPILTLADRRRALEFGAAIGNVFGGERQVMGTGFYSDWQAFPTRLLQH